MCNKWYRQPPLTNIHERLRSQIEHREKVPMFFCSTHMRMACLPLPMFHWCARAHLDMLRPADPPRTKALAMYSITHHRNRFQASIHADHDRWLRISASRSWCRSSARNCWSGRDSRSHLNHTSPQRRGERLTTPAVSLTKTTYMRLTEQNRLSPFSQIYEYVFFPDIWMMKLHARPYIAKHLENNAVFRLTVINSDQILRHLDSTKWWNVSPNTHHYCPLGLRRIELSYAYRCWEKC